MKSAKRKSGTVPHPPMFFKSLYHAECETGREAITLRKRLKAKGISTDGPISVADVCAVLVLAKDQALEEKLKAETRRIEREEAEAQGELCQMEAVKAQVMEWLLALRRDLESDYRSQGRLEALDKIFAKYHTPPEPN
jgi:hypothetical protein